MSMGPRGVGAAAACVCATGAAYGVSQVIQQPPSQQTGRNDRQPKVQVKRDRDEDATSITLAGGPQVAYSVPVEDLQEGELLQVLSQLGATNDLTSESPAPGSTIYGGLIRYPVDLHPRIVFGKNPDSTRGVELVDGRKHTLSPDEHHGVYVDDGRIKIGKELAGKDGYINLVVDAGVRGGSGPERSSWLPGMEEQPGVPSLDIDDGHGGLDVLRIPAEGPGAAGYAVQKLSGDPVKRAHRIAGPADGVGGDQPHPKTAVVSLPLGALRRGEIIDARASAAVNNLAPQPTLAAGELLITDSPSSTEAIAGWAKVTESHGTNIAPGDDGYVIERQGALKIRKNVPEAYLNLAVSSGYVGATMVPGGALELRPGSGGIQATRYTPVRDR
jgi:hypothetical protein